MNKEHCDFQPEGKPDNGRRIYRCTKCGTRTPIAVKKPPFRKCRIVGEGKSQRQREPDCIHLGELTASVQSDNVSCGCGVRVLQFYECGHFNEPVLKHRVQPAHETAEEFVRVTSQFAKGYTGRSCSGCPFRDSESATPLPPPTFPPVHRLVAVTSYFNPQRSVKRRENYELFAQHMTDQGIELYTGESLFRGTSPELPDTGGVIRIPCDDVLWHKERTLNHVIESLPEDVDAVMWIDADLIFARHDLRTATLDGLQRWPVLQPWSTCTMLQRDGTPGKWHGKPVATSVGSKNRGLPGDSRPDRGHPGFAWAARRETLREIDGLYDRLITGSGDTAMAIGFYGELDTPFLTYDRMSPAMLEHWLTWARRASIAVRGRVGYLSGEITHLYHGEVADRGYKLRWTALAGKDYDPHSHVEHTPDGALQWTESAPQELRDFVADYLLHQRKEP